MTTQD
jgi:hypothetical protein